MSSRSSNFYIILLCLFLLRFYVFYKILIPEVKQEYQGDLYSVITLIGDRTIVPVAIAWAPSEKSKYTKMLLEMLEEEIDLTETCLTDESMGIFKSFEKVGISNQLCT